MKRWCFIVLVVTLVAIPMKTYGWFKSYDAGGAFEGGEYVHQTADGGYLVLGYTDSSTWLLKTSPLGDSLWSRIYSGGGKQVDVGFSAAAVFGASGGGYIIFGSIPAGYRVFKINAEGNVIWTRSYEGTLTGVRQTSDGGYIVAVDGSLIKHNPQGFVEWEKSYSLRIAFAEETSDGDYILSIDHYFGLLKTDSLGDSIWCKIYIGEIGYGYCLGGRVMETSDDGYILSGTASPWLDYFMRILARVDSLGDTLWTYSYSEDIATYLTGLDMTADGGYIVTGGDNSTFDGLVLSKFSDSGDTLWERWIKEPYLYPEWLETTSDGGFVLTGFSYDKPSPHMFLYKTDAGGNDDPGIAEEPSDVPLRYEVVSLGREIVLRYSDLPGGFHASIFDASGCKVDELHSTQSSGALTWGEGFIPGVYFVVPLDSNQGGAQKVVLVK
ncbi:hypothetical protein JXM67_04705 [candidate division WOR-3 bacterium]|nr:hypothetical protein [candidate division WOR-3 bacterium]